MTKFNIDEILKFEPVVNIQMLLFLFLNAVAFDSLYRLMDEFVYNGDFIFIKWIVYTTLFIVTLTAFGFEYEKLNR